jgi:MoaA/NifB/PqqE/SkfB family radical SAM enzyme
MPELTGEPLTPGGGSLMIDTLAGRPAGRGATTPLMNLERLSIEVTNRCAKACWFCYNNSQPAGATAWTADELVAFVTDCAAHGVKAASFGGGEPLQYEAIFEVIERLRGVLFRSLTTNGLLLDGLLDRLELAAPNKVHVSIHFPEREAEVRRVIRQVQELAERGVRSGVNFLVARPNLDAARRAAEQVRAAGIDNERIVYLPMRGRDTPTPREVASVAGDRPFQSMTCLTACGKSPRFCSVGWDRSVAWCSYTTARVPLREGTFRGLEVALDGLGLEFCGGTEDGRS